MKRFLSSILVLVFIFALVGCGDSSSNGNSDVGNNNGSTINSTVSDTENVDPYIGTWQHEKTDAEPYSITLTLENGGTGAIGVKNKTQINWSEISDGKIKIIITYSDNTTKDTTALCSGDTLVWDYRFSVKAADGIISSVNNVTMKKK